MVTLLEEINDLLQHKQHLTAEELAALQDELLQRLYAEHRSGCKELCEWCKKSQRHCPLENKK